VSGSGWASGSVSHWGTGLVTWTVNDWASRWPNYSVLPWHLFQVTM
jgi:hypothetical protein